MYRAKKGSSIAFLIQVKDSVTNLPINITGWQIVSKLKTNMNDKVIDTFDVTIVNAVLGQVRISSNSNTWKPSLYYFDLKLVNAGTIMYTETVELHLEPAVS